MNKRFEKLASDYGFQIKDVFAMINGIWCRRPDIQSVSYKGHHLMTIPRKMSSQPTEKKTLEGSAQPFYFECEYKLRNWNFIIKRTPHIQNLEKKKMELEALEKHAKSIGGLH